MELAVLTQSPYLPKFIDQCLMQDNASCKPFFDVITLARAAAYRSEFRAILVDAAMGLNALRLLIERRAFYADSHIPVIVVSMLDKHKGVNDAFDAGADDVVLAPIQPSELTLRVRLALHRAQARHMTHADSFLEYGGYQLEKRSHTVFVHGIATRLTPREFALAWLLFSHAGHYVSRRQIAASIWDNAQDVVARTLEQHIYKLRKKLNLHQANGVRLQAMYSHGYRIEGVDTPSQQGATEHNKAAPYFADENASISCIDDATLSR